MLFLCFERKLFRIYSMTYKEMGFSQEKKKSGITAALNFFFLM